ncbi:MAG: cupin domain-containing protein [Planctomycetota bacterium]|nr:MAG: cupin domain-containing protein [Planctomycetota bacterium]
MDDQDPRAFNTSPARRTAEEMISALGLVRHPEGGFFRETFRAPDAPRGASTSILFLLSAGERSRWHRVDADEHWLFHAGDPLELEIAGPTPDSRTSVLLGSDIAAGEQPQAVVPRHWWQAARSHGEWTLVGCVVAPAFDFAHFEMAPEGWEPV